MSENFVRHLISIFGTLVAAAAYWGGFMAGKNGWWLTAVGLIVVYVIIYKLVEV